MADVTEVLDRMKVQNRQRFFDRQRSHITKALANLDEVAAACIIDHVIPIRQKLVELLHRLDAAESEED